MDISDSQSCKDVSIVVTWLVMLRGLVGNNEHLEKGITSIFMWL
jgi:hypothetical protein